MSSSSRFDILGIGNAIVDVLARVEDSFLSRHDMHKGAMALIDTATAEKIYTAMGQGQEASGGSAANTCAVAAGLGARVAFLGKVADDALGQTFRRDIEAAGVHFPTAPLTGDAPTARCLILVTPDGQRTMNTYLGACVALSGADVDEALIGEAAVTYLEGYLFDPPAAQQAFFKTAHAARQAGRKIALTLSDAFCVHRHRDAFRNLVKHHTDILFANEAEITALYETNTFEEAAEAVRQDVEVAALTRSGDGSVVVSRGESHVIPPVPTRVVDATGAGDAYAAGFLIGMARGRDLLTCGTLGSAAAALAIGYMGARPPADLLQGIL